MKLFKKIRILFGRSDVVVMDSSVVETVRDMQNDLDAYAFVFTNLIGYLRGKFGPNCKPCIQKGLAASGDVRSIIDAICNASIDLRRDYDKVKRENERLKDEISKLKGNDADNGSADTGNART